MTPQTPGTNAPATDSDNVEPIRPAMAHQESVVGLALRQAREAKGKSIEQVAARLRIKASFLAALESGESETLPGLAYALGFVRTYAEFLDLDPGQIVQDYKHEVEGIAQPTDLSFPVPPPNVSQFPGIPVAVVSTAILLAGLAGWYVTQADSLFVAEGIATPPGLSSADLRIVTEAAPAPPPAPHIAATLLDLTRSAPSTPQTSTPPPSTPTQIAAYPTRQAAPAPAEQIPWPAYVLPAEVASTLQVKPPLIMSPRPPAPLARPKPPRQRPATVASAPSTQPSADTPVQVPTAQQIASASPRQEASTPAVAESAAMAKRPVANEAPAQAQFDDEAAAGQIATVVGRNTPTRPTPARTDMQAATEMAAAESISVNEARLPSIPQASSEPTGNRTYGQANRDARIVIAAQADIWIQIRDADQNNLFTRLLHTGDRYQVPNRTGLLLFTGNAGGLKVTVDGKPVAPLGAAGAVRRDIALNADQLLAGTSPQ